jgi:hypothetical protein
VSVQVVPETLLMELFHSHRGGIFDLHVDEVQKLQGQQLWDTDNKIRFFTSCLGSCASTLPSLSPSIYTLFVTCIAYAISSIAWL